MRPGEFWEAMTVWQADKEADRRHVAEVIRGVGVRLFNVQLKQKDQIKDVRKFMMLPWDEDPDYDEGLERLKSLTDEERTEEAKEFLDRINWK